MGVETQEMVVMPERLIRPDESKPLGFAVDSDAVARFMERATPRQKAAVVADLIPTVRTLVRIAGGYVEGYMKERKMKAIPLGDGRKLAFKKSTPVLLNDVYKEGQRLLGEDGFGDEDEVLALYGESYSMELDEPTCQELGLDFSKLKETGRAQITPRPGGITEIKAAVKLGGPGGQFLTDQLEKARKDAPEKLGVEGKKKISEHTARIDEAREGAQNPQLNPFAPKADGE